MSINPIEINTKLLDKDTNNMLLELADIKKEMNAMFDSVKELDTMWEGAAKAEFVAQFNKDYEKLKDICTAVMEFVGCMIYASEEYFKCETTVNDLIETIKE